MNLKENDLKIVCMEVVSSFYLSFVHDFVTAVWRGAICPSIILTSSLFGGLESIPAHIARHGTDTTWTHRPRASRRVSERQATAVMTLRS